MSNKLLKMFKTHLAAKGTQHWKCKSEAKSACDLLLSMNSMVH